MAELKREGIDEVWISHEMKDDRRGRSDWVLLAPGFSKRYKQPKLAYRDSSPVRSALQTAQRKPSVRYFLSGVFEVQDGVEGEINSDETVTVEEGAVFLITGEARHSSRKHVVGKLYPEGWRNPGEWISGPMGGIGTGDENEVDTETDGT